MQKIQRIGLGGGCHWCTEAVFQSLKGVGTVRQGFISSYGEKTTFSEAVVVHFDVRQITLKDIIAIHLHTHKSTSQHAMRAKYRSAIYTFIESDPREVAAILGKLQVDFEKKLITQILPFVAFKPSDVKFKDYYQKNPEKPFCKTHIAPKFRLLMQRFSGHLKHQEAGSGSNSNTNSDLKLQP